MNPARGGYVNVKKALLTALLALSLCPAPGAAQATLRGRVIDSEIGQGIGGASVQIRKTAAILTDTLGLFEARDVPQGDAEITIQVIGYTRGVFYVHFPASGDVERVFALDFTGARLPAVVVEARAEKLERRYVDFEQRRQRRIGTYLRWDELERKGYASVGDALRTVRGVRIRCDQQTFECFAFMVRTPQCQPTWWVDGVEVRSFHENTSIRDVYGIEVYRGAGEVPGEFAGSDAGCGVIVVWTKSRPFRISP
ncbi:MAG TPA: carboxypeptidase regulatory-like domain-containing protein [Gemmatimonadales bacterium]|nr:carboxypeptidase regulatory-like domain-containing protein [Gemmatimonadales bacterium]